MMKRLLLGLLVVSVWAGCEKAAAPKPVLVPEQTDYNQTSGFENVLKVMQFAADTLSSAELHYFGSTVEGRRLPLLVISDRAITSPLQARTLNRPAVLLLGGIHGGEVAGKEALLRLALAFADGEHAQLLKKVTILMAPVYNADGNEAISKTHRINQNGPFGGVGTRVNAEGYNLNRDFVKLDAPESQGMVGRLLRGWDPMLLVDLHTTNGSYHGYHMTYAPPLGPNTDERLIEYHREDMLPVLTRKMKQQGWNTGFYGFFPERGRPDLGWITYSAKPRYSTNYYGLRNRYALLSEAYSYLSFDKRIAVQRDFVMTTLKYLAKHGNEMQDLAARIDREYQTFSVDELGVTFDYAPPVRDTILAGSVDTLVRQDVKGLTFQRVDRVRRVTTKVYGRFRSTHSRTLPFAYAIDNRDGVFDEALQRLRWHGIPLFTTDDRRQYHVRQFVPNGVERRDAYEQHEPLALTGTYRDAEQVLDGWVVVPTNQALRNLVFYLLEPEVDDGLFYWNFFDKGLHPGEPVPVVKIPEPLPLKLMPLTRS